MPVSGVPCKNRYLESLVFRVTKSEGGRKIYFAPESDKLYVEKTKRTGERERERKRGKEKKESVTEKMNR